MAEHKRSKLRLVIILLIIALLGVHVFLPTYVDKSMNQVARDSALEVSDLSKHLHQQLTIMDWHADTTLWDRDLLSESDHGHVDLPRLQAGNVALQMFTTVTRVPAGLNYDSNPADGRDQITPLIIFQAWPTRTWSSLLERALYQAERVQWAARDSTDLMMVLNKTDLQQLLSLRQQGRPIVGALIGTEGAHPLEGSTRNVQTLFDAGFRMMSLQHFFDNDLGGSLHGESNAGLSKFGKSALAEMERQEMIVDVSHSSHAVVRDVLELATRPVIVSHTGVHGQCQKKRNLPDDLMQQIADKGGLIAIGYWEGAVCSTSVEAIVAAIRYAIDLVGIDHVALGSDFDGAVKTPFDTSEIVLLIEQMRRSGFTDLEISQVMGENSVRFLLEWLPD